ncbi:DUF7845 domain-containing protein [Haloarcula argentinensis]|uniref:DUF7845 domain-containing protein n=1 Tax=Haloarcula argentinensis TaxID=43776 RepID=A0ABU2EYA5_HALAR|nr:hypothetical protein [Haloarcula argentinensis]EMA24646.1 hypothetical protein C443_05789 [Haloarcula argentinensis DSM 12282]MDS0253237.1 hypothetical protein [Haloarcula argentinensis]
MSQQLSSTVDDVIALQPHRLAANLLFDDHGLSPYWAISSQFEPDLDEQDRTFTYNGRDWEITNSAYWEGKLAAPDAASWDGAMNEFKISVYEEDDPHNEYGADLTFRPGYPDARHVDTGDLIGGIPTECPESIRLQVEATNLSKPELLGLLQSLASHLDVNPDYFTDAHAWSSIYGIELYGRIDRETAVGQIAGKGGVLEHMAQFSNGRGRGEHKWDHEQIKAHYEAVSLSPDLWERLLPDQTLAKRLKCYQPQWVRSEDDGDDPLYHHKIECQFWKGYYPDGEDSLDWSGYSYAIDEMRETIINALNWAGVDFTPNEDVWVDDPYFTVQSGDSSVEVFPNPMPDLEQQERGDARDTLADPDTTSGEWDVLVAMTDGGGRHYDEIAQEAGRSPSTVYRAAERFDDILEIENGVVRFQDGVIRDEISKIAQRVRDMKDTAMDSMRRIAEKATPFSRGQGEPSALEQWANRHGIVVRNATKELHLELSRAVSKRELQKILRAGLEAAEASPMLTKRFENAKIDWQNHHGEHKKGWQIVMNGRILGYDDPNSSIW